MFSGSSTLGTLGAVVWAVGLQDQQIPLPVDDLGERDRFEALIEVSAPVVDHPWQWQPETPRVLRLIVGDKQEWYEARQKWGRPRADLVVIKRNAKKLAVGVYANEASGPAVFGRGDIVQFIDLLYESSQGLRGCTVANGSVQNTAWKNVLNSATLRSRVHEGLPHAVSFSEGKVTLNVPIEIVQ